MEDQYIPGIFNYCDRWCEHCSLAHRCTLYAQEQKLTDEQKDVNNKAFWEYISQCMNEAMQMLHSMAEEEGIDLENIEPTPPKPLSPNKEALSEMAREYAVSVYNWLKENRSKLEERRDELIAQMEMGMDKKTETSRLFDGYETVQWYAGMIGTKTGRAMMGYDDMEEWYVDSPLQSDANGTAKVALLCIERSMGGWQILYDQMPDQADTIIDYLSELSKIRKQLKQYFPQAEKFIRPGFDEDLEPA